MRVDFHFDVALVPDQVIDLLRLTKDLMGEGLLVGSSIYLRLAVLISA